MFLFGQIASIERKLHSSRQRVRNDISKGIRMPNTVRRTLTLIKLTDGVWVVESKNPLHHPGTSYASEAKFSLLGLFQAKATVFDPLQKATRALKEVFFYLGRTDLEIKPHFHREGIEWHPVIAHMHVYHIDSSLFAHKKKKADWTITPLSQHRFAAKLQKLISAQQ